MRTDQALLFVDGPKIITPMVTVWQTPADSTEVVLPFTSEGMYDCLVDWGDGSSTSGTSWDGSWARHTYATAGTYTVTITGTATHWSFNNGGSKDLLYEVTNLGTLGWTSFARAFYGCSNLGAVRGGDLSAVTDTSYMFAEAPNAMPVTDDWDMSLVQNASYMFYHAVSATPNTTYWDTSSFTTIAHMFDGASSAQPNTTSWDTSSITDFSYAFAYTVLANPNVSTWDMSSALTIAGMFCGAEAATPVTTSWSTGTITDMSYAFAIGISNPNVASWDVSKVTTMAGMFYQNEHATPDTATWVTTSLTSTEYMFCDATLANPNVASFNMTHVTTIQYMFYNAIAANPNTSAWVTTALLNADYAFSQATAMTNAASADAFWNNTGVTSHVSTFSGSINVSNYVDIPEDWGGGSGFKVQIYAFAGQTFKFQADSPVDLVVSWGDGTSTTYNATGLTSKTYTTAGTYVVSMHGAASRIAFGGTGCTPSMLREVLTVMDPVTGVTSCENMFYGCTNLYQIVGAFLDTNSAGVISMRRMFKRVSPMLQEVVVTNWDVSAVQDMSEMFAESYLTVALDSGAWNTGAVLTMSRMFHSSTTMFTATNWDTHSVTDMSYMLYGTSRANPNVSTWNVSNVENFSYMFANAKLADPDTSAWVTTSATNMDHMFYNASVADPDVSGFTMTGVTTINSMFMNADAANPDTSSWVTTNLTDATNAFRNLTTMTIAVTAATFWDNAGIVSYADCFTGAENVANYDDVPTSWGGRVAPFTVQIVVDEVVGLDYTFYSDSPSALHVNWGDGSSNDYTSAGEDVTVSHTYTAPGTYDVRMWGATTRLAFNAPTAGDQKLRKVVTDIVNIAGITSCRNMFRNNAMLSDIVSGFLDSTSGNVTDMSFMFRAAPLANPVTTDWDTSKVITMVEMFRGATSATPNTTSWDVSNVVYFRGMFYGATSANPAVTSWNLADGVDISYMFYGATSANPNVASWNTAGLVNCEYAFYGCSAFVATISAAQFWESATCGSVNHHLCFYGASNLVNFADIPYTWGGDDAWEFKVTIPKGTDAETRTVDFLYSCVGYRCTWGDGTGFSDDGSAVDAVASHTYATNGTYTIRFAADVMSRFSFYTGSGYQTKFSSIENEMYPHIKSAPVLNLSNMFRGCDGLIDLLGGGIYGAGTFICVDFFKFTGLTPVNLSYFLADTDLSPDLSLLPMGAVTTIAHLLDGNSEANPDTSNWDVSSVTDASYAFANSVANPVVTNWDVSSLQNASYMFYQNAVAAPNVSNWCTMSLTTTSYMFYHATSSNPDMSDWLTDTLTDVSHMLEGATGATVLVKPYLFWERATAITTTTDCFKDAVNIANYNDIPSSFGGVKTDWLLTVTVPDDGDKIAFHYTGATDLIVDWGDGTTPAEYDGSGNLLRQYATAGTYTVKIHGACGILSFSRSGYESTNYADAQVTGILNALNNAVTGLYSTSGMFYSCTLLSSIYAYFLDAVSGDLLTTSNMFRGAVLANPDPTRWDLSGVSNASYMFYNAAAFNPTVNSLQFWHNASIGTYQNCFTGSGVSNMSSIPTDWGGTASADASFNFTVEMTVDSLTFQLYLDDFDVIINWGDGSNTSGSYSGWTSRSHTYAAAGTYTIKITGSAHRLWFYQSSSDAGYAAAVRSVLTPLSKLTTINSTREMFYMCTGLTFIRTDFLDAIATSISDMYRMFSYAAAITVHTDNWNMINVTNLYLFCAYSDITLSTKKWNTSHVTTFRSAFSGAPNVQHNLRALRTDAATDVRSMVDGNTGITNVAPAKRYWKRSSAIAQYAECFKNASNILNYANIPSAWKTT